MEWWENDGYEAVDEFGGRVNIGGRQFAGNVGLHGVGASYRNTKGEKTSVHANKKQLLGTAAAGVGAYKVGKWAYNKFKGKNQAPAQQPPQNQQQNAQAQDQPAEGCTNCEGFSWIEDPGAQHIMESYFSEFADADMYDAPEPHPYSDNEWDA
jgi:hypothetical protein